MAEPAPAAVPVLRVARPTNGLAALQRFYCDGAGFEILARFEDHGGFSGLIVGHAHTPWHLEFVEERGVTAPTAPSAEHLLVLYLPDPEAWRAAVDRMMRHGYDPVPAHNPYWETHGRTFQDPDGYRLVFQNRAWTL